MLGADGNSKRNLKPCSTGLQKQTDTPGNKLIPAFPFSTAQSPKLILI